MKRAIVTYAAGAHEELLDIALPGFKDFAHRHGYDMLVGSKMCDRPPAWNKVPLLRDALGMYEEVVWFDCDLVVVDAREDFPPLVESGAFDQGGKHALVRHFEGGSEVPNSGVWRLTKDAEQLLSQMWDLSVFWDHGWWEQAALMTLMGYKVPPQDTHFPDTKCRVVHATYWHIACKFMRLCWNSHPNYRADKPRIVHCSYPDPQQRIEVMRAIIQDPTFAYPKYEKSVEERVTEAYRRGQEDMRRRAVKSSEELDLAYSADMIAELPVEEWDRDRDGKTKSPP